MIMIAAIMSMVAAPGRAARAQTETRLANLTIKVWPEFDQPNVLVFYIGQAAGPSGETALAFTLPPGAAINAVAYQGADGNLLSNANYKQTGDLLTVTSPNGSFHIEFYDPALKFDNDARSYQSTWNSPYAVDQLDWYVQQPVGAGALALDPASSEEIVGEYDLFIQRVNAGSVAANSPQTLKVSYSKSDSQLSWDAIQQQAGTQPSASGSTPPASGDDAGQVTLLIVAAVAAVALGAAFTTYYVREVKGRSKVAKAVPPERFCAECGTQARPADKFCRKCGAKLKAG